MVVPDEMVDVVPDVSLADVDEDGEVAVVVVLDAEEVGAGTGMLVIEPAGGGATDWVADSLRGAVAGGKLDGRGFRAAVEEAAFPSALNGGGRRPSTRRVPAEAADVGRAFSPPERLSPRPASLFRADLADDVEPS